MQNKSTTLIAGLTVVWLALFAHAEEANGKLLPDVDRGGVLPMSWPTCTTRWSTVAW